MFVLVHRYVRLDGSAEPSHTHLAPPLRPRRFRPQLNAPSAQLLPDVRADLGAHIQQVCAGLGGSGLPGRPSGLEVCAAARWREASRILWVATDALLIHTVRLVVHRYCIVEHFMFFFYLLTPQFTILDEFIYLLVLLFSQNTTRWLSVLHLMCPQASKYIHQLHASISMFDYCNLHSESPYSVWATLHASSHCFPGSTNKSSRFPPGFKFTFGAAQSLRPSSTQERT